MQYWLTAVHWFLSLFFTVEEINGHGRCPTYLYRFHLFKLGTWKFYLHRFVADDWSLDLHDHPKRFISVMLFGGYYETSAHRTTMTMRQYASRYYPEGASMVVDGVIVQTITEEHTKQYRAPHARTFPPEHSHRVYLGRNRECWTFVVVLGSVRQWGFWNAGRWIPWKEYVRGKFSHLADARAVCRTIGE